MTKVLVVDDKEENRYYLQVLLESRGMEVQVGRHGAEALVLARQERPDLVISDLLMPIMDGYTLLHQWKHDASLQQVPFVVFTATYTTPQDERLALDLGADDFILKPMEPKEFLARVEKVLNGASQGTREPRLDMGADQESFQLYSQTLIRKLEEKSLQLEAANQALEADLAERKKYEAELCRLRDELEERVHERTRELELASREADAARESAEEANRAKSDFLSRMSHELRTPLNAIIGFGQILELRADPANLQQKDHIQHILKAGHHLLDLINEVLDIARIEAGHLALSPQPVDIARVIREALDGLHPLIEARHIEVRNLVDSTCGHNVLADRQRLKQVLLNLFSNGVKYNRESGTLQVSCVQADGSLRVFVTDSGAGIEVEGLERIFEPFERLEADHSGIEGTGIGLSLCKRLVEAMDGRIGVESTPGQGSTFWFELPLTSRTPQEPTTPVPLPSPGATTVAGSAHTILYIEDNLSNIQLMERLVATYSPDALFLPSMQGSLGLELASQYQPDIILLDVNLQDMSGEQVLRRLKAGPLTRHIPVLAISADALPNKVERMLELGALQYLTKPLDVPAFLKILDGLLGEAANKRI